MRPLIAGTLAIIALAPVTAAAAQDAEAGAKKAAELCAACHGATGNSPAGRYPSLAGQTARYIYLQLKDFNEGRRTDSLMTPIAKTLTRDDMFNVAAYFSAQELRPADFAADAAKVAQGQAKAAETLCTMCHGGGFLGQNEIPRVAGQHYEYTVKQLRDFRERKRTNDAGNMTAVARTLSDEDIENLAQYLATLR